MKGSKDKTKNTGRTSKNVNRSAKTGRFVSKVKGRTRTRTEGTPHRRGSANRSEGQRRPSTELVERNGLLVFEAPRPTFSAEDLIAEVRAEAR